MSVHRRPRLNIPRSFVLEAAEKYKVGGLPAAREHFHSHGFPLSDQAVVSRCRQTGATSAYLPRGTNWTLDEIAVLQQYYPDPTVALRDIETMVNHTQKAIELKARNLGLYRCTIPPSPMPRLIYPQLYTERPLLVISDLHVPYHDAQWMDRVVRLAAAWGTRQVVMIGDVFDAQSISRFEIFNRPTLEEEKECWGYVEAALLDIFEELIWTLGNHEFRMSKLVQYKLSLKTLVEDLFVQDNNRVTVYDSFAIQVNMDCPAGGWHLEHPKSSGQKVALDLVGQHGVNAIAAHTHHTSVDRDTSGRYFGIRMGACADHSRQPYCNRITHGKVRMTQGAVILVPTPKRVLHYVLEPEMDLEAMHAIYKGRKW